MNNLILNLDITVNKIEDIISEYDMDQLPSMLFGVSLFEFDDDFIEELRNVMLNIIYEEIKDRL